jgi:hypothetical protein
MHRWRFQQSLNLNGIERFAGVENDGGAVSSTRNKHISNLGSSDREDVVGGPHCDHPRCPTKPDQAMDGSPARWLPRP